MSSVATTRHNRHAGGVRRRAPRCLYVTHDEVLKHAHKQSIRATATRPLAVLSVHAALDSGGRRRARCLAAPAGGRCRRRRRRRRRVAAAGGGCRRGRRSRAQRRRPQHHHRVAAIADNPAVAGGHVGRWCGARVGVSASTLWLRRPRAFSADGASLTLAQPPTPATSRQRRSCEARWRGQP